MAPTHPRSGCQAPILTKRR